LSIWLVLGISLFVVAAFVPLYSVRVVGARRVAVLQKARAAAIAAVCAERGLKTGPVHQGILRTRGLVNAFSSADGSVVGGDISRSGSNYVNFFSLLEFTLTGLNLPRLAVLRIGQNSLVDVWGAVLELESTDFDKQFAVIAKDRRSAVMLLDQAMMQWLMDCERVSFEMIGDRVAAFIDRGAEPAHPPAEPVEFELLFKFYDGFVNRVPPLLRSEYSATG
jgi:hypothetical protein